MTSARPSPTGCKPVPTRIRTPNCTGLIRYGPGSLHPNDTGRPIRALEITAATGQLHPRSKRTDHKTAGPWPTTFV
ncbi:MAG: hypothetical protein R2857_13945 [Vampirovibrionales bacterium]